MMRNEEIKILIVDDIKADAEYLKRIIEGALNAFCYHAHTLGETRSIISKLSFDCILLDIYLDENKPQGMRILQEFKSHNLPIIIVSAYVDHMLMGSFVNELTPLYIIEKPYTFHSPHGYLEKESIARFGNQIVQSVQCAHYISMLTKRNAELELKTTQSRKKSHGGKESKKWLHYAVSVVITSLFLWGYPYLLNWLDANENKLQIQLASQILIIIAFLNIPLNNTWIKLLPIIVVIILAIIGYIR